MKQIPNLFQFATKELSQDAFISWALAWADPSYAASHPALHDMGTKMLKAMFEKHGVDLPSVTSIGIRQQVFGLDILVLVGETHALLIEDKIHASEHSNQLERYAKAIRGEYPAHRLLPILAKTGDQSTYRNVLTAGYQLFLRRDFIDCLQLSSARLENAIVADFCSNLVARDRRINAYRLDPVRDWLDSGEAWTGLYEHLQSLRSEDNFEWDYVPNPTGGFMGAWWHFKAWSGATVYLQLEQGALCFKISPPEGNHDRAAWRNEWHERLMSASTGSSLALKRPKRFGSGVYMTAALIQVSDWMKVAKDGLLDLEATLAALAEAEALIDSVIANAISHA